MASYTVSNISYKKVIIIEYRESPQSNQSLLSLVV